VGLRRAGARDASGAAHHAERVILSPAWPAERTGPAGPAPARLSRPAPRGAQGARKEHAMNVGSIMSTKPVTVQLDDKLALVKDIFDTVRFHHLLAVEGGRLYGVVSDRDLLRALSPYIGSTVESARDLATLNKRVHQIMTRKPITLGPQASVADAVALFLAHGISCIPIVDAEMKPVGILSWRDILRALPAG
jgi:acetoin utilization protein AcuB